VQQRHTSRLQDRYLPDLLEAKSVDTPQFRSGVAALAPWLTIAQVAEVCGVDRLEVYSKLPRVLKFGTSGYEAARCRSAD